MHSLNALFCQKDQLNGHILGLFCQKIVFTLTPRRAKRVGEFIFNNGQLSAVFQSPSLYRPVQTCTIRRGALKFATLISPFY